MKPRIRWFTYELKSNAFRKRLTPFFNHAERNYGIAPSPCKKLSKAGTSKSNETSIWAKAEYQKFLDEEWGHGEHAWDATLPQRGGGYGRVRGGVI
ncbi:hypothetical protein D7W09_05750 [bacterium D16-34]|nr:hypothetical protein D7W09_05750 [bacterium D16-34]